jgi:hypothetical protein
VFVAAAADGDLLQRSQRPDPPTKSSPATTTSGTSRRHSG